MNDIEALRYKKFSVLDQGFCCLTDVMGSDADICRAARVSYGAGTRSVSDDRTLIRYLMRNRHTTPFEMAVLKFHVRVPMDCWRQWIRHRMSSTNEYSTRYSEAIDAMQATPADGWRLQSDANRQGSGGFLERLPDGCDADTGDMTPGEWLTAVEDNFQDAARAVYEERLRFGVAREQARKDLPLSTYTEAYWKIDLHNLLHFLSLRMDPHAQLEIRSYATVIGREIVAPLFPLTWEAFELYRLDALTLTSLDVLAIRMIQGGEDAESALEHFTNKRERGECRAKLERLGFAMASDTP